MGISTYPRYGFRLAPLSLKEILDVNVPKHLVGQEDIKFYELDESSWEKFGEENCLKLSELIIKRCNAFFFLLPKEISERNIPQFQKLDNLQDIELEESTLDCLNLSLSNKKINYSELAVTELTNFRCLGMKGLIDLLTSLETETCYIKDKRKEGNNNKEKYLNDFIEVIYIFKDDCEKSLQNVPEWVKEFTLPELQQNFKIKELDLKIRTEHGLKRCGFWGDPRKMSGIKIRELFSIRSFGFYSVLDLLTKLELFLRERKQIDKITFTIENNLSKKYGDRNQYYEIYIKALKILVENKSRKYPKWVKRMKMPILTEEFNFLELDLKIRTKHVLKRIGVWEAPQKLSLKTITDLLNLKNFGLLSLLDLMKNLEPYVKHFYFDSTNEEIKISQKPLFDSISYQPSLIQKKRLNSIELKNEATKLLELEIKSIIKSDDFRFGDFIQRLDKKAEDICDLATRIIMDENISSHEKKTLTLLKELFQRVSSIQNMKLEDEFDSFLLPVKLERNKKIISGRFGLDGNGLSTLQSIGDEFQVTRERIRQICKKWTDELQESSIFAPILENTIQFITENAPNSCDVMMEKLVAEGITEKPFQLENIKEIVGFFKIDCPFILKEVDGKMYILSDASEIIVNLIHKKSRKAIEHWGTSTIEEITFQLSEENQDISNEFVEQVLNSRDDFYWLDKESGWFWLNSVPRNRLFNQMKKVLSVAEKIDISELRSGISRHHRTKGLSPPKRVLLEFCKQTDLGIVKDNLIISDNNLNWKEELSNTEKSLVLILKENSNVMKRIDLEKICMELGMSNPAFQVSLSYSPVIVKFGTGVYGLRGVEIPIGLIESLTNATSRRRGRVLKDFGWKNNNVWIAYQLSESSVKSGVIGVPASVKDYIGGEFRLKTEENETVGRVVIRETSAWGFSSFLRRRGGEIGDYMLLVFDTVNKEITIHIGDEDLIEEFQEVDS